MRNALLSFVGCVCWLGTLPLAAQQPDMPKPGPEQKKLHQLVGDWDATVAVAGSESKATATYKMGMGGFFLFEDFKGEFAGQPFHGKGTTGYDPLHKRYVSSWVDSMSPSMLIMHGHFSDDGKTYTEGGEGPGMDGKPTRLTSVFQFKDKDTIVFSMYTGTDTTGEPMMKITYHRKK